MPPKGSKRTTSATVTHALAATATVPAVPAGVDIQLLPKPLIREIPAVLEELATRARAAIPTAHHAFLKPDPGKPESFAPTGTMEPPPWYKPGRAFPICFEPGLYRLGLHEDTRKALTAFAAEVAGPGGRLVHMPPPIVLASRGTPMTWTKFLAIDAHFYVNPYVGVSMGSTGAGGSSSSLEDADAASVRAVMAALASTRQAVSILCLANNCMPAEAATVSHLHMTPGQAIIMWAIRVNPQMQARPGGLGATTKEAVLYGADAMGGLGWDDVRHPDGKPRVHLKLRVADAKHSATCITDVALAAFFAELKLLRAKHVDDASTSKASKARVRLVADEAKAVELAARAADETTIAACVAAQRSFRLLDVLFPNPAELDAVLAAPPPKWVDVRLAQGQMLNFCAATTLFRIVVPTTARSGGAVLAVRELHVVDNPVLKPNTARIGFLTCTSVLWPNCYEEHARGDFEGLNALAAAAEAVCSESHASHRGRRTRVNPRTGRTFVSQFSSQLLGLAPMDAPAVALLSGRLPLDETDDANAQVEAAAPVRLAAEAEPAPRAEAQVEAMVEEVSVTLTAAMATDPAEPPPLTEADASALPRAEPVQASPPRPVVAAAPLILVSSSTRSPPRAWSPARSPARTPARTPVMSPAKPPAAADEVMAEAAAGSKRRREPAPEPMQAPAQVPAQAPDAQDDVVDRVTDDGSDSEAAGAGAGATAGAGASGGGRTNQLVNRAVKSALKQPKAADTEPTQPAATQGPPKRARFADAPADTTGEEADAATHITIAGTSDARRELEALEATTLTRLFVNAAPGVCARVGALLASHRLQEPCVPETTPVIRVEELLETGCAWSGDQATTINRVVSAWVRSRVATPVDTEAVGVAFFNVTAAWTSPEETHVGIQFRLGVPVSITTAKFNEWSTANDGTLGSIQRLGQSGPVVLHIDQGAWPAVCALRRAAAAVPAGCAPFSTESSAATVFHTAVVFQTTLLGTELHALAKQLVGNKPSWQTTPCINRLMNSIARYTPAAAPVVPPPGAKLAASSPVDLTGTSVVDMTEVPDTVTV